MTSGTSGVSSGCVFDFEAILLNGKRHADAIGQRADDTVLLNLPLYFSFALSSQALASLTRGNRLIISGPPFHQAGYQEALKQLRRYRFLADARAYPFLLPVRSQRARRIASALCWRRPAGAGVGCPPG